MSEVLKIISHWESHGSTLPSHRKPHLVTSLVTTLWTTSCGQVPTITESSAISVTAFSAHFFLKIKALLLSGHVPSCSVLPYVLPLLRLPSAVVKGVECVGVGRGPICRQAPRTLRRWAEKMRTPTPEPRSGLLPPAGPAKFREKFPEN